MWWERPGLDVRDGRLHVAGRDAEALAREHGTPLFAYDLQNIGEQARSLQDAFARLGQPFILRYALKANREPATMAYLRSLGEPGSPESIGMDVCSPGEVLHSIKHGWEPGEISYTGTNVSERDLDVILEHGVHMNLDLLTQIRRYGRRAPGTRVGIRVNPRTGARYRANVKSLYASDKPTKFGIYAEQLEDALAAAREHDLVIDRVHFHVGYMVPTSALPDIAVAVQRVAEMTAWLQEQGCPIEEINMGGGLGVVQRDGDEPLDVDAYAKVMTEHLGPLGVTLAGEPGDFHAKRSGVLLMEVVTVEDRLGVPFAGCDAGFNVGPDHFVYETPRTIVVCRDANGDPVASYTVSGNINEGPDLWGEDVPLPDVQEGDIVAVMNMGAYDQSMASIHCLRPHAASVAFPDRI